MHSAPFTCRAAPAQLLLPTFGAALTEQPVVAHQQLHRGELVEAGLDGALLGAGCVAVGQSLKGPLVVLMVEIISALCFSVLLQRTVSGCRAVPRSEAQADFRNRANYLFYGAALPGRRRRRRRRGGDGRRGWSEGGGGWRGRHVSVAGGAWGPLALGSLAVSVVAAVLSARVSLAAVR